MKYEKLTVSVIELENEDIVTASGHYDEDQKCAQPSWDADNCDGVTQAVTKPF